MAFFRCSLLTALTLAAGMLAPAQTQKPANAQSARIEDPANLTGERVSPPDLADTLPINHGAPALQQLLLKLRTRASMMMIVAHPDDEDGGLLAYESRGQGARVAMLTLTRGEGGQNLMTADFDDALGLLRTQELLAADRYMGVDQMFGTEVDFGFSKTKEESFKKWSHDRVLYDAVRAVRLYRPLVLASVFVGGVTDGHGQHQVSGEICQEVFLAAADPKVFPEMGLAPWAPLKVYARVPFSRVTPQGMYDYATGRWSSPLFHNYISGRDITTEPAATVLIHEGETSTALGMEGDSYVQFARRGLALQKTQIGAGVRLAPAGVFDVGYTRMGSRLAAQPSTEQSFFDGIDTSLPGIATLSRDAPPTLRTTLQAIDAKVAEAQKLFDPAHLERTAPPLREALLMLDPLIREASKNAGDYSLRHELQVKRVQFNNALLLALGVEFRAVAKHPRLLTSDTSVEFSETLSNKGSQTIKLSSVGGTAASTLPLFTREQGPGNSVGDIAPGSSITNSWKYNFLAEPSVTRPYFSRSITEQPFYDVADPELRNAPGTPPPLISMAWITDNGVELTLAASVQAPVDPKHAERLPHSLVATPPISIALAPALGLITPGSKQLTAEVRIDSESHTEHTSGNVRLLPPAGWYIEPPSLHWSTAADGKSSPLPFTLAAPARYDRAMVAVKVVASLGKQEYTESFRPVGYPGLPFTNYYAPTAYKATVVDVHTAPHLRVAYLPGTGDAVADLLCNLGITPTLLTVADLTPANLAKYDAVVLGVRAYAAHPELAGAGSGPLLDYANAGGIVIVQYNTARYGNAEAPFPITVPGDPSHNVVEEAQPVSLLEPNSPVLAWPNRITSADFDHWVAERGHGFASDWDSHYVALVETHDPGQDPQKGGLLYAKTGKGAYIYLAYALYRQLPEGVPGPYRIFANLLSLGKNPGIPH